LEQNEADLRCKLEERLRFETLLVEISARFVNLPTDQIDGEIEDAQRRICECLGLDLSALWQWSDEKPRFLTLTHLHSPPEGPLRPEGIDAQEAFPWVLQKMLRGEVLVLSTESMPPEAARDQEMRRHFGVKSSVVIPLSAGGRPIIGVLTFDTLRSERAWPDETVKQLSLIAQVFTNALDRKRSEEALRESETRLSLAADSAEAGLWELDCSTNLFWATERAREIFGYGPEEVISMERFETSIHPDDLELVRQVIARALGERELVNVEYRILLDDGCLKWIFSRGRPYFESTGEPDRLMGVSLDITERKRFEHELEERSRFEQLLSDMISRFSGTSSDHLDAEMQRSLKKIIELLQVDRIWLMTMTGDSASWQITHAACAEGIPPFPLQADLPKSLFPWLFGKIVDQREVVSVGSIKDLPLEADIDRESLKKWGIQSFINIPIVRGKIISCVSMTTDQSERDWPEEYISRVKLIGDALFNAVERKKMAERVRKAVEEWQCTFDSIPDTIMILDRNLKIRRHNAAAASFFKRPTEEITGRQCHHLMHGTNEPPLECPAIKSLGTRSHQENEVYDAERNATYQISSDPIIDRQGQITQIVHRIKDITKRRNAEAEARQHMEEIAHVTRISMMGELTTALAHEINQPLTAILSNAEAAVRFLSQESPDIGEIRLIFNDIIRDNRRARDIVQKVRSLAKKDKVHETLLDLNGVIREILTMVRGDAILLNLSITTDFSPSPALVTADRIQLQQVILNLLMNSGYALRNIASGQRKIIVRTAMPDSRTVKVIVKDFGTGIDENNIARLFDPFYTTKAEGLGVGLSISQRIIQAHGGAIEASNNPEGGATFAFTLPAHQGDLP